MVTPSGEEIVEVARPGKIEEVKEVAFEKSDVEKVAKLKIAEVSFGRRDEIDFGLLANVTIGKDKKEDRQKPKKLGDQEREKREDDFLERGPFLFGG